MTRKTAEWLEIARHDLKAAEVLLDRQDEDILGIVGFLSQQAVEKVLKGFLCSRGLEPPRTHDVSRLIDQCSSLDPSFSSYADEIEPLNPFAVDVRYPSDLPDPVTFPVAADLVAVARRVLEFAADKARGA
jgi:HEPN domain-containing protein